MQIKIKQLDCNEKLKMTFFRINNILQFGLPNYQDHQCFPLTLTYCTGCDSATLCRKCNLWKERVEMRWDGIPTLYVRILLIL